MERIGKTRTDILDYADVRNVAGLEWRRQPNDVPNDTADEAVVLTYAASGTSRCYSSTNSVSVLWNESDGPANLIAGSPSRSF